MSYRKEMEQVAVEVVEGKVKISQQFGDETPEAVVLSPEQADNVAEWIRDAADQAEEGRKAGAK